VGTGADSTGGGAEVTTHELARLLLEGPDLPAYSYVGTDNALEELEHQPRLSWLESYWDTKHDGEPNIVIVE
jgi:hypothetical protein